MINTLIPVKNASSEAAFIYIQAGLVYLHHSERRKTAIA